MDSEAWSGCVIKPNGCVKKTITQAKLNKSKENLVVLRSNDGSREKTSKVEYKFLERFRGYLNHVSIAFPLILPYLKGYHIAIDARREGRHQEGLKAVPENEEASWLNVLNYNLWTGNISESEHDEVYFSKFDSEKPPQYVLPTPRLFENLEILEAFFFRRHNYTLSRSAHQSS